MISKILRLVVNVLTADEKYSLLNGNNLTQPIQMQLSQKKKTFPGISFTFLKSILNLEHFQKKENRRNWCISEITDFERRVQVIVYKVLFWRTCQEATWQTDTNHFEI